ncbi:MAG: gephyrin-like molybdotransferase Glp [Bacteroidales bacterium]
MVSFESAYKIVSNIDYRTGSHLIDFKNSLGRILAEDVISDMDMPPFDKSAMDGYACRYLDIKQELEVVEIIPAGKIPEKKIDQGQCAKIMTGAMLPEGADCVIMVEDTAEKPDGKILYTRVVPNTELSETSSVDRRKLNICYKGEDIKKDDIVIKKGTLIKAQHIAVMASVGRINVMVAALPKVAVIPTGNEIVEPTNLPLPSQIRNSNGPQLIAQLKNLGIEAQYCGIAADAEIDTIAMIEKASHENEILLLTGGVSKGDYDLVPAILKKLNFELHFDEIAVQPGKPTVFGNRGNIFCFGLPGNPVSGFVQFELLVKPLIFKMMGFDLNRINLSLTLGTDFTRKTDKRLAFIPVSVSENGEAIPLEYHGSAHINGLDNAWGLMFVPVGKKFIKKGEKVDVRQI